jgi:preprotein translocase SecE subunit
MKLIDYIRDTRGELKHVSWLSSQATIAFTALVIVLVLAVSIYLAIFDGIFGYLIERFILNIR